MYYYICISRRLGPTSFCPRDQQAELPWFRVMTNQVFKHQAESKVRENVWANLSLETSHLEVGTACLSVLLCRSTHIIWVKNVENDIIGHIHASNWTLMFACSLDLERLYDPIYYCFICKPIQLKAECIEYGVRMPVSRTF